MKYIISKSALSNSLLFISITLVFLLPFGITHSYQTTVHQTSATQLRSYKLVVTTQYNNFTSSYYGILELMLNTTGFHSYQGCLSWNLTWDNGDTWSTNSSFYTYGWNRTYYFGGLLLYTGWWIHPGVQIGDHIRIDGDAPATNNFLRTAPFTVTDLISLQIQDRFYLCWQLYYTSNQPQYETYYYECNSGILISASSLLLEGNNIVHQANIELSSASPAVPIVHFIVHYWINYQSLILALLGATLFTLFVHFLLQRLLSQYQREHRLDSRQNA